MRLTIAITLLIGVSACGVGTSDAAFCAPKFTTAIDRLAKALPHPDTPEEVGKAGTAVVFGHDAGCQHRWISK